MKGMDYGEQNTGFSHKTPLEQNDFMTLKTSGFTVKLLKLH